MRFNSSRNTVSFAYLLVVLFSSKNDGEVDAFSTSSISNRKSNRVMRESSAIHMQKPIIHSSDDIELQRRQKRKLAASSVSDFSANEDSETLAILQQRLVNIPQSMFFQSSLLPVMSASLMITGNTVGAGMLVLPELMSGPGPILSFSVLIVAWFMNLISGLVIAQVAIQQHESSGTDVPSSFKEFAEATLPNAASIVCGISIAINTLILAFDVFKAGQIGTTLLPDFLANNDHFLSYFWGACLACLVSTQSLRNLSQVAGLLVMGLFTTFASLLLPGLANISDVGSVMTIPPTLPSEHVLGGVLQMAPVVITTLVFQNIVPTITRLLDYDRIKITTALTLGSFIPLMMYLAWSIAMLGGGIDASSSLALSGLISCFSLITVAGSSLGTSMSLSEEFEIILGQDESNDKKDTFSFPSVAAPIGIALLVGQLCSSDITDLLKIAGSFGSPILYGAIPVAMTLMQRRGTNDNDSFSKNMNDMKSVIPGGSFGLGLLGIGSTALVGTELLESFGNSGTIL